MCLSSQWSGIYFYVANNFFCIAPSLMGNEQLQRLMGHWNLLKVFYPEKQSRRQGHRDQTESPLESNDL